MVLDFDEIDLKSVIGSGAFATVFRGIYRYKIAKPGDAGGDKKMVRRWFFCRSPLLLVFVDVSHVCLACTEYLSSENSECLSWEKSLRALCWFFFFRTALTSLALSFTR